MLSRMFVCGTGRSGTWILYKVLGCHAAVHTFPKEMRFIIDPDGVMDLVTSLSLNYHPVHANEMLYRFERLMRVYLTHPDRVPYKGFDLPTWIGEEYYRQRLDQFCSELIETEYGGVLWQAEPENEGKLVSLAKKLQGTRYYLEGEDFVPYRITLPRTEERVVKYFPDRKHLIDLAASFIDDIFTYSAKANDKETWCEKTPQHLLNLDFMLELFPESVFIHIKRDPRGVVHSMTKQIWAPSDVRGASLMLRNVLERWFDLRSKLDLTGYKFLEYKLEDFASDPATVLEEITAMSEIENRFINPPEIKPERVDYWQNEMSAADIDQVNDILGSCIESMGYAV